MGRRRRSPHRTQTGAPADTLRVIGGRLRGRKIAYLGDPRTRPMKQRVREAAFNLLGTQVAGAHVIDLFAGTGALTWEALSRGAVSATLVERHFPSARLVRENAKALGLVEQVEVVAADTFFWARQLDPPSVALAPDQPWLVFCSPPYDLYVSKREEMLQLISRVVDSAPPHSRIVVEADGRFVTAGLPDTLTWDVREYPPAVLALAAK